MDVEAFVDDNGEINVPELLRLHEALQKDLVTEGIKHRREVGKLKAELGRTRVERDDPLAADVKALMDLWWREIKGSNPKVRVELDSPRAGGVKKALKDRAKGRGRSLETAKEDCRRAILGIFYDDWAMGRIKKSRGNCFNDLTKHILADDDTIEKFMGLYERHAAANPDLFLDVPQAPPKLELVQWDTTRDDKSKAGLSTWPDTLGGGRERRAELSDTLRLIAVTLKQWERREREAA